MVPSWDHFGERAKEAPRFGSIFDPSRKSDSLPQWPCRLSSVTPFPRKMSDFHPLFAFCIEPSRQSTLCADRSLLVHWLQSKSGAMASSISFGSASHAMGAVVAPPERVRVYVPPVISPSSPSSPFIGISHVAGFSIVPSTTCFVETVVKESSVLACIWAASLMGWATCRTTSIVPSASLFTQLGSLGVLPGWAGGLQYMECAVKISMLSLSPCLRLRHSPVSRHLCHQLWVFCISPPSFMTTRLPYFWSCLPWYSPTRPAVL